VEAESITWGELASDRAHWQYDPTKIVNWGINRWAFKPEFGYSERWGNWALDAYAGVWFYTTNPAFDTGRGDKPQNESPIGSLKVISATTLSDLAPGCRLTAICGEAG
jgi:hypothetical protein